MSQTLRTTLILLAFVCFQTQVTTAAEPRYDGSWESLPRLLGTDESGNTIDAQHLGIDTERCIIRGTEGGHVIATVGVDDLIVVHTPDATLIAKRGDDAAVRKIVDELKAQGYDTYL